MTSSSASAVVASRRPARGAVGGAAGEAGSIHRAGVAAIAIVHGLVGQGVPWLPHDASPVRVTLEGDAGIDDIVIELDGGLRAFVQAKLPADMGRELKATVDQWVRAFNEGTVGVGDSVALAVASPSQTVRHLAIALDARRRDVSMNKAQGEALEKLERLVDASLSRAGDVAAVLDAARIAVVDGRDGTADTDADLLPLHALAGGVEPLPLPGLGKNIASEIPVQYVRAPRRWGH